MTYMGEEMDRRDRGNRTVRYREAQRRALGPLSQYRSPLWALADAICAAAVLAFFGFMALVKLGALS